MRVRKGEGLMVPRLCIDGVMSSCGCVYDILNYRLVIKENRFNEESEQSMAETTENTVNLPYRNPELPTEERIADLLGRMTLEEKVGQMMQLDARSGDLDDLIVNKHVGSILHTSPSDLPKAVETVNAKTRLGIPLVIGDDCIHGYSFGREPPFSGTARHGNHVGF